MTIYVVYYLGHKYYVFIEYPTVKLCDHDLSLCFEVDDVTKPDVYISSGVVMAGGVELYSDELVEWVLNTVQELLDKGIILGEGDV